MRFHVAAVLALFGVARAVRPLDQGLASSVEDLPRREASAALERRGAAVGNATRHSTGVEVLRIGAHGQLHAGRRSRTHRSCPNLCSDKQKVQVDNRVKLHDGKEVKCGRFEEYFVKHSEECSKEWYAANWDKFSESCCKACDLCLPGQVLRGSGSEGGCPFIMDRLFKGGEACDKIEEDQLKALRDSCCVAPPKMTPELPVTTTPKVVISVKPTTTQAPGCSLCQQGQTLRKNVDGSEATSCRFIQKQLFEDGKACESLEEGQLDVLRKSCCTQPTIVVPDKDECALCGPGSKRKADPVCSVTDSLLRDGQTCTKLKAEDADVLRAKCCIADPDVSVVVKAQGCQLCEPNTRFEDGYLGELFGNYPTCAAQRTKIATDWATCADFEAAKSGLLKLLRKSCCFTGPKSVVGENPQKVVPEVETPCTLCNADEDFLSSEAYGTAQCTDLQQAVEADQASCKLRQNDTDVALMHYFCCAKKGVGSSKKGGDSDGEACPLCGPDEVVQKDKVFEGSGCEWLAKDYDDEPRLCKAMVETGQAGDLKMIRGRCCAKKGSRSDVPEVQARPPGGDEIQARPPGSSANVPVVGNVDVTVGGAGGTQSGVVKSGSSSGSTNVNPDAWKLSAKYKTGPAVCTREDIKKLQGLGHKVAIWKDKSGPQKMREDISDACAKLDGLRKKAAEKELQVIKARTTKDSYMESYLSHFGDLYARETRINKDYAELHAKEEQAQKASEALKQLKSK